MMCENVMGTGVVCGCGVFRIPLQVVQFCATLDCSNNSESQGQPLIWFKILHGSNILRFQMVYKGFKLVSRAYFYSLPYLNPVFLKVHLHTPRVDIVIKTPPPPHTLIQLQVIRKI